MSGCVCGEYCGIKKIYLVSEIRRAYVEHVIQVLKLIVGGHSGGMRIQESGQGACGCGGCRGRAKVETVRAPSIGMIT